MKKRLCILFILLLIFPIISAIEINMTSEYPQGQTVIASVSGNFIDPITKNNIYFYRGHVRTSFDYDVARIGDKYYFYFQLATKLPNNYSVVIKDVRYFVGSQVSKDEIKKNFTITQNKADFSVKPGFVITNGNFSLKVQNLQTSAITININTETTSGGTKGFFGFFFKNQNTGNSVNLMSGETKDIDIRLTNITETTIRTIKLSTDNLEYKIPAYVIIESKPQEETPAQNQSQEKNETEEQEDEGNQTQDGQQEEQEEKECTWFQKLFGLCKNGQEDEKNQTQENGKNQTQGQNQTGNQTTGDLNETQSNKTKKEQKNETQQKNKTEPEYEIIVEEDGSLTVIEDGKVVEVEASLKTCAEMKGYVCSSGELCTTKTVYAQDNKCCVTKCAKQEEKQNNKFIAWVIVGALILIILWFFKSKFSKTKHKKDVLLGKKK